MNKILKIIESRKHYDGKNLVERMEEYRTLAISIVLIENFKISSVYTHGVKNRTTNQKITPETLFQAASISKPVFAVAVMRLVEQKILDLNKDIFEYLPDFKLPTYDNKKHKITLKQLLSHHSGMNLHGFAGYQHGQQIPTIDQILNGEDPSNHLKLKLVQKPEKEYKYSGGGYVLAQKVLVDVCKSNFCDLMNDLVLTPFKMTNSSFSQPLPQDKIKKIAFGYNEYNLPLPNGYNIMPELAAAGLWTTPSDLALFGIEIMKSLNNESEIINKTTTKLMTTKAYKNSPSGIGFELKESKKGLLFGHSGSNAGYHSNMLFCPEDGTGIVIMQNSDIGWPLCIEVVNSFKEIFDW